MGELVNLRRARKLKQRVQADAAAAANRLRHGRSRSAREGEAMIADRAARHLDGAKLEGAEPSSPPRDEGCGDG